MLFTDTDSLVYEIETEDVCEFFDAVNKKFIGKMKDKFKGKIIGEFVGLKSKMYSLVDAHVEENKKAKGLNMGVTRGIRHKEYIDVLFGGKLIRHKLKGIQSTLHRIRTYDICKISLSCFDDKRYILDDGINLMAYFHKGVKSR